MILPKAERPIQEAANAYCVPLRASQSLRPVQIVRLELKRLQLLTRRDSGTHIHCGATRLPGRVAAPGGVMGLPGLAFNSA
jgi:hypothetical protein